MHPFDIKTVLFAKHAQHVVLIHFPIALFTVGVLFDFLAQWKNLVMGSVSSVLIWVVWIIHKRTQGQDGGILPAYCLPIEAVAVAIVTVTGHLGGFLSGVNGPG